MNRWLLPAGQTRVGSNISVLIAVILIAPSPALTVGSPVRFAAPAALAALALQAMRRSSRIRSAIGAKSQRSLHLPAVCGALLVVASIAEPTPDKFERAAGRGVSLLAFYFLALLYAKSPSDRPRIRSAVVVGAVAGATIALVSSALSLQPFGSDLLPHRSFILPIDLPKTTGMPRSFGEAGLIFAGGLAMVQAWPKGASRLVATSILLAGFAVGQSRNMLLVLAAFWAIRIVAPRIRRVSRLGTVLGLAALMSPILVSALVSQSNIREQFVGEGIFERNVESRLSLAHEVGVVADRGWLFSRPFGATRLEWLEITSAAPHNHFVSLLVMDGYVGVLVILSFFVMPILRIGRGRGVAHSYEFQWFAAAVVALSFYEGAFSATLTVALALFHGTVMGTEQEQTPTQMETLSPKGALSR